MRNVRIVTALAAAAAALSVPPAHAAASITVHVTLSTRYGACATVTRSSGLRVTTKLETHGAGQAGTVAGAVDDAQTQQGDSGVATACTGALPFVVQDGAITMLVTWQAPATASRSNLAVPNGAFAVYCTTVQSVTDCSPPDLTIVDLN